MPQLEFTARCRQASRKLRDMGNRSGNLMPVWPKVGNIVSRSARRAFSTRGASLGKPWKPYAISTRRERALAGYPAAQMLVRSGDMKETLVGRPMRIERYYKDHADYGTDDKIAFWQQRGTRRHGKRHIPPRVMLSLTAADKDVIRQYIIAHIGGRKRI